MIILVLLYMPVMIMIYRNQHQQAVIFKSPKLILLGGMALFIDSANNVFINWIWPSKEIVCYLSIFDTFIFHYIAYFSLIFRASRIFKVMGLEKKYLTKIYNLTKDHNTDNEDISVQKTTSLSDLDQNTAPLVPNNKGKLMTASDFEKQMKKTELKKDQELHNCREAFYFRRIFVIVATLSCIGVVMIIFKSELFMLMPIYRSDECNFIIRK